MNSLQGPVADSRTGFFSEVWRGSWQGIPVAIKQLDPTADKKVSYKFMMVQNLTIALHQRGGRLAPTAKSLHPTLLRGIQCHRPTTLDAHLSV